MSSSPPGGLRFSDGISDLNDVKEKDDIDYDQLDRLRKELITKGTIPNSKWVCVCAGGAIGPYATEALADKAERERKARALVKERNAQLKKRSYERK